MKAISGLAAAFMLLTRLPVSRLPAPLLPAGAVAPGLWAFPVVGMVVGLCSGGVLRLGEFIRLPPLGAACWSVIALVLLTGALHEDGLADTADGFGGGRDTAQKLSIMRDSRIGTFGAIALVLSLLLRVTTVAALPPTFVLTGLVASATSGRAAMLIPLMLLSPVRAEGLGASLAAVSRRSAWIGLAISIAASLALLPVLRACVVSAGTVAAGLVVSLAARRQVGGYTGDILGAAEQIAECVALTVLSVG